MNSQPVLILGAGINGASLARELALNDVSCWVIDRGDIACGATSKSSRLIHGGLRYLEYGEFRLVREALDERDRLLRLAPHFVKPLTFSVPVRRRHGGWLAAILRLAGLSVKHRSPRGLWITQAGLRIYDWLSRRSRLPSHAVSNWTADATPKVSGAYRWICRYIDAQMPFPERYTLGLLRDAQEISARAGLDFRVLTHHEIRRSELDVEVLDLRRTGTEAFDGKADIQLKPPLIVNATGAWGDDTLSQLDISTRRLFGGTKGSHFLAASAALRESLGDEAVYAETLDGRFVFILPFGKHVLIGTTDEPFVEDPHRAVATPAELDYLFALVRDVFPGVQLTTQDIVCHYSGVRPLPYSEDLSPGAVSRDHHVELTEGDIPVLTLIGGKLTTSRKLGEQVADMVINRLGRVRNESSRDRVIPGGRDFPIDAAELANWHEQLARDLGCDLETIEMLASLCGTELESILSGFDKVERAPISGTRIPRGFARWVIRSEWVRCLADLVERRLMLVLTGQLTEESLRELGQLLVDESVIAAADLDREVAECRLRLTEQCGYRW